MGAHDMTMWIHSSTIGIEEKCFGEMSVWGPEPHDVGTPPVVATAVLGVLIAKLRAYEPDLVDLIRKLVMSNEMYRVGEVAFVECRALREVVLPRSITHVGDGVTCEDDIWAVMHAENIKRGGEWIETRLLASGQRTNPWFQECGPRITRNNEIIAFDTDLIGAYGICIDISRTWWIGDRAPRQDMIDTMRLGVEHIQTNMEMLKPGVMIPDLTANCHVLPDKFQAQKYGCLMHGVGLCDEWPLVAYPDKAVAGAFDYPLEPGMTLCVEVLLGEVGGDFSVKLEDQVLITEDGYENLTKYPFDPALMGETS